MVQKGSTKFDYIITAAFSYGPFRTKAIAEAYKKKVSAISGVTASPVSKVGNGFKFGAKFRIGCKAADKARAYKSIKSNAPAAKVTVAKV